LKSIRPFFNTGSKILCVHAENCGPLLSDHWSIGIRANSRRGISDPYYVDGNGSQNAPIFDPYADRNLAAGA